MENRTVSKYTTSFGLALALSSLLNAVLVVVKEKSPAVQAAMKSLTGHHWITHAAIVLALFAGFGFLLAGGRGGRGWTLPVNRLIPTLLAGVVVSGAIIVGFYLLAD